MKITLQSTSRSYQGFQKVYKHSSTTCHCEMTFAVYLPPQASEQKVPVIWWLSGLTCSHENAMVKGGLQAHAARFGLAIIFPDTSPRGEAVANDDSYDMGQGAGFYVNATEAPWNDHFQMYDYITSELPALIAAEIPEIDQSRSAISGHSMGGHGALTIGLKNPERYRSISAFAPMANPIRSETWGRKQFKAYLGPDERRWMDYDACHLLSKGYGREILIDQGSLDPYWDLLQPESLKKASSSINFRLREGYDHSYFFVSSFAEEHFAWHSTKLEL